MAQPRAAVVTGAEPATKTGDQPQNSGAVREIGDLAVWTVTSAKPGNGVEMLRDNSSETFWQSDGTQPHQVHITFQRKVELVELALYVDFKADESYTPKHVSIRVGNSAHDVKEVRLMTLDEPIGWVHISLLPPPQSGKPRLRAYVVHVVVLSNHQSGRDTHIRQLKVFGPRRDMLQTAGFGGLTTVDFSQYAVVR